MNRKTMLYKAALGLVLNQFIEDKTNISASTSVVEKVDIFTFDLTDKPVPKIHIDSLNGMSARQRRKHEQTRKRKGRL